MRVEPLKFFVIPRSLFFGKRRICSLSFISLLCFVYIHYKIEDVCHRSPFICISFMQLIPHFSIFFPRFISTFSRVYSIHLLCTYSLFAFFNFQHIFFQSLSIFFIQYFFLYSNWSRFSYIQFVGSLFLFPFIYSLSLFKLRISIFSPHFHSVLLFLFLFYLLYSSFNLFIYSG